jgi:hypothetical protein
VPTSRLLGQDTRGQQRQSFGRSRGGFSTKIHLKTDLDGNPLDFHLTGGEASDSTLFETSLDIGPDIRPRIADKGYDSQANRAAALARGIAPVNFRDACIKRRFFRRYSVSGGNIRHARAVHAATAAISSVNPTIFRTRRRL